MKSYETVEIKRLWCEMASEVESRYHQILLDFQCVSLLSSSIPPPPGSMQFAYICATRIHGLKISMRYSAAQASNWLDSKVWWKWDLQLVKRKEERNSEVHTPSLLKIIAVQIISFNRPYPHPVKTENHRTAESIQPVWSLPEAPWLGFPGELWLSICAWVVILLLVWSSWFF